MRRVIIPIYSGVNNDTNNNTNNITNNKTNTNNNTNIGTFDSNAPKSILYLLTIRQYKEEEDNN